VAQLCTVDLPKCSHLHFWSGLLRHVHTQGGATCKHAIQARRLRMFTQCKRVRTSRHASAAVCSTLYCISRSLQADLRDHINCPHLSTRKLPTCCRSNLSRSNLT
jgi:hypothetical protein